LLTIPDNVVSDSAHYYIVDLRMLPLEALDLEIESQSSDV
jgi:hypothetical protein